MASVQIYKSYSFRNKDPAIDELRTIIEDHFGRRISNKDLINISAAGGPAAATMAAWFFRKTRRPQSATLEAAGRAIGYRRKWFKDGTGK
jgi:hypothetical protein